MWPNPQEIANLVTFTEESLNGKLHFCAVYVSSKAIPPSEVFECEAVHKICIFCMHCFVFQEQLSMKAPLGDCLWVFSINFCKFHGKYFLYQTLFSLCFIYLYSEWSVETSTTTTTENRRYFNNIFLYYKSYQKTPCKRKMWGAFEEDTGEQ